MRKRNRKGERWWDFSVGGWRRAGFISLGALVGIGVVMGNPMIGSNVWATIGSTTEGGSLPSGAKVDLNSTKDVQSTVTLTMDSGGTNGRLNASAVTTNPDAAADVVKRTATVELSNTDGYVVNIKANSTNLTGTNASNTIASVSANSTLGQMTNTWGWNGSIGDAAADCNPSDTFKPMKTTDQQLGNGGAITSTQNKKVTMCFGSRIDGSKVADTYSNIVTLSVVAQPGKTATFNGITQMQQMTSTICSNANINDTAQLTDTRDNKKYWVTKLLDGNCWMSQNLDFNISSSNVTTATSDVTSNWTSSSSYPPQATTSSVTTGSTSSRETYSWDLGNYVIINPTAMTGCSNNNTGLSACSGQFMAVGSRTASTDPNFYQKNGATYTSTEYDAHYLAGNYYQWNAATAGTGGTITNANASGSICPKNWKLPSSATNASTITKGTYAYLLQQYGLASAYNSGSLTGTSSVNSNTYNIALSPLFFVLGGGIYPDQTDKFRVAGRGGSYWSSRADSNNSSAYNFNFGGSGVYLSSGDYRYVGFSLRCLIPTT